MATYVVYGDTSDGYVYSQSATYLGASNGSSLTTHIGTSSGQVGQIFQLSAYYWYESFFSFTVPDFGSNWFAQSATISLFVVANKAVQTTWQLQARQSGWGPTLATDDWVPGSSLASLPLLGSISSSLMTVGAYADIGVSASGLSSIVSNSPLYIVANLDLMISGSAQASINYFDVYFANQTGTTNDPKLTITTEARFAPYLFTGKLGHDGGPSSSRPGFLKLGSRYSGSGVRMNATIKGPVVTSYPMNANLYPNRTTLTRTMDAALVPAYGAYVSATASAGAVVTVGVYQGTVNSGPVTSQQLYRVNPTSGTQTLIATSSASTFTTTDAAAPLGVPFSYICYGYNAAGTLVCTTSSSTVTLTGYTEWYLSSASGTALTLSVSDSSSTIVRQDEGFSPISLAYKVVQQGKVIGRRGAIELVVTSSDRNQTYGQLRNLAGDLTQVYLKNPFGDVYAIDIGAMAVEFVGTGNLKITVPFIENAVA